MKRITLFSVLLLTTVFFAHSQKEVSVLSPDGNLKFVLKLLPEAPVYQVTYKNRLLIGNSALGFDFDSGTFAANLKINKTVARTIDETYDLVVGKTKTARNYCKEKVIGLEEKEKPFRKINLVVRAFNDGIAFRFEFPEQTGWKSYVMYDEKTTFGLKDNPRTLALFLPSFTTSHEGLYTYEYFNALPEEKLMDMPATFVYPDGTHLAITEAALRDYAGMYLVKQGQSMTGKLSPWPGQDKVRVKAGLPHQTPWRVMMIGDRAGVLIESNILTNLNEPCKIGDTSWLKPGKTTFTWWNGNITPDTTFSPGNNYQTNKYYIDFASRSGLEYHSIYGYAEQPWYIDDGFDFSRPGPNVDITKTIAPLNMKAIVDYAKSRGVDIHVWVNWKALYARIDKAFAQFEQWGISGMMVDFMDRDDQEMIRIQEEILAKAAKHHLFIQFHGSSKPSGLHRTYPNEFTREGTLNYEVFKWNSHTTADHDISMPFTRMLAGATDYHLGGFRAVPRSEFKVQYTRPLVTSTRCHMLAMYVVLESYLHMVADTPPSYEGQPGFEFIQKIPTTWDETQVPLASVNEYVSIARRKGDDWYIGCLNNSEARRLDVPLRFLEKGQQYIAEIYTDAGDADKNPNRLVKQYKEVTKDDTLTLHLAIDGGAAVHICKKQESSSIWIQPSMENEYKLRWGFRNGIRIGLTPNTVVRGNVSIYLPYAGINPDVIFNFFAIEPVPQGENERGFSELERSQLDNRRGKRIWTSNNDKALEPRNAIVNPAPGIVQIENGEETLTVYFFIEPFQNQAKVYLKARFYASKPYEVEITTYKRQDSRDLTNCIITATMGNYARLRKLYLQNEVKTSLSIWPDYKEFGFAPHEFIPMNKMITGKNGYPYFIATPDEENPQDAQYIDGTANHWKYTGKPVTQYWYCKDPDNSLQGIVNGRVVYWASQSPIPGGISFENFEMKKQFKNGDRFVFGVSPLSAEKLIEELK